MIKRFLLTIAFIAIGLLTSLGVNAIFQGNQAVNAQTAPSTQTAPGAQTSPAMQTTPGTQTSPGRQTAPGTQTAPGMQTTPGMPTAPGMQTTPGAQTSPARSNTQVNAIDRAFVMDAAQAGVGNIQLGQLALQRASAPQVKQFAQAEINEQTQAKAELARIGPRIGITPPTTPAPRHQAALARLSQLSGQEFDRAYLDEGGVNAHLENAAVYQREAAFGQNPDLLTLVNKGLPTIRQHFETASTLTNYKFAQVPRKYNNKQGGSGASLPQAKPAPAKAQ